MDILFFSILCLTLLGISAGWMLVCVSQRFSPKKSFLVEEICKVLPGVNCGACGFSSCNAFAEAVTQKKAAINGCLVGKEKVRGLIAKILSKK